MTLLRARLPVRYGRQLVAAAFVSIFVALPAAQAPVFYRFSFPERNQRVMHVEVTFPDIPPDPLEVLMSRSSPGRYAIHDFASHVLDVSATDSAGRALTIEHPNPNQWTVSGHSGEVRLSYRVRGDQVNGTYLGVDGTHAHINMPAAIIWGRGLEKRGLALRFEPPPGTSWRVATQLLTGRDAFSYSAPNLQYLMDSPTEVSAFALRTFTVGDNGRTPVFRVAVHHSGTDAELDAFVRDVESIVRETRYVFGEYPRFEGNTYTFIADYLLGNNDDGMEHRNSAVLTSSRSIRNDRMNRLIAVSHEFCHAWNAERIRPASLEPFNFEETNVSGELWFAEGFCNYYGSLVLRRSGLWSVRDFARDIGEAISDVVRRPGRETRSVVEMSRLAPLMDGADSADSALSSNFVSYYTWGEALAVGLDLMLRDRTGGRVTLDDYMRALWAKFGRAGGRLPGYVELPYTETDLKRMLADVSGDAAFADGFFARFVDGREVIDYAPLLARAGLIVRTAGPTSTFDVVPVEDTGQRATDEQQRFRDGWLSSGARNVF
jgi:predicted metalloprotease with PDZ domain